MVLFLQMLYRLRIQVLAYGLGLAVWAAAIVFIFPSVEPTIGELEYPQEILDAFGVSGLSLADPRAFFGAEFFSLGPLVLGAFIVFASTAALAGEESAGTMEVVGALPVSRAAMFATRGLAVLVASAAVIGLTILGWVVAVPFVDLGRELTLVKLAGGTMAQLPFAAFLIALGLLFGAVAPSRSTAAAYTGGLLILFYLLVTIGSAVEAIEDVRYASPYYYADLQGVLIDGLTVEHQATLWGITLLLLLLAFVGFEGREFGSDRWQFEALLPRRGRGGMTAAGASPAGRRGRARWLSLLLLLVVLSALGAAGVAGYRYTASQPPVLKVSGRVDAPSITILAPASGTVAVLGVAEQQDVRAGDVLGWIASSADQSSVPVTTPHAGRITSLSLHQGQFATAGTPVIVIHELGALYASLEVDEDDIGRVHVGQSVDLDFTSTGARVTGAVGFVSPIPTTNLAARAGQSRKYEVRVPLDGAGGTALVGQPVDATVHLERR